MRIGLDGIPLCPLHAGLFIDDVLINGLTNGRNNGITLDHKLGAWNWHGSTPTTGIRLTELVFPEFNACDFAIFGDDARRADKVAGLALSFTIFNLFKGSAHLFA